MGCIPEAPFLVGSSNKLQQQQVVDSNWRMENVQKQFVFCWLVPDERRDHKSQERVSSVSVWLCGFSLEKKPLIWSLNRISPVAESAGNDGSLSDYYLTIILGSVPCMTQSSSWFLRPENIFLTRDTLNTLNTLNNVVAGRCESSCSTSLFADLLFNIQDLTN